MVLWRRKNCLVVHSTNSIIVCALAASLAFLCASWASVRQMERHQRLTRPQMRELTSTLGKESPAKSFLLQQLYVFYDKGSRCVYFCRVYRMKLSSGSSSVMDLRCRNFVLRDNLQSNLVRRFMHLSYRHQTSHKALDLRTRAFYLVENVFKLAMTGVGVVIAAMIVMSFLV